MQGGVYPTQDTSRMRTARVKQEEKADENNNRRVVRNMNESNIGKKRKSPKQDLTSANNLNIMLPYGRYFFFFKNLFGSTGGPGSRLPYTK